MQFILCCFAKSKLQFANCVTSHETSVYITHLSSGWQRSIWKDPWFDWQRQEARCQIELWGQQSWWQRILHWANCVFRCNRWYEDCYWRGRLSKFIDKFRYLPGLPNISLLLLSGADKVIFWLLGKHTILKIDPRFVLDTVIESLADFL